MKQVDIKCDVNVLNNVITETAIAEYRKSIHAWKSFSYISCPIDSEYDNMHAYVHSKSSYRFGGSIEVLSAVASSRPKLVSVETVSFVVILPL